MAVIWRRRAIIDVGRIAAYISEFNPHAAARMVAKLNSAARSLASSPLRGRRGDAPETRELSVVQPYVIVYRVTSTGDVEIVRIWHAAQSRQEDL